MKNILTILLFAGFLVGQPSFDTQTIVGGISYYYFDVYAVDMDGDSDVDVLSAHWVDDQIAWYENDGSENFTFHTVSSNPDTDGNPNNDDDGDADGARSVYAVDLDDDGDMDVLSASERDHKIAWYENNGSQSFTTHIITNNLNWTSSVYAVDIDDDGDMDVVASGNSEIVWYENNGSESFTAHTLSNSGAKSIYAVDMDDDGDMDVLSAAGSTIDWYENNGSESFTTNTITTDVNNAWSVYALDVDIDGDVDVLSASYYDDKIAWYENDGSENFTAYNVNTPDTDGNPNNDDNGDCGGAIEVYAVDIDGDVDIDVMAACADNQSSNVIVWYENDGSENFIIHSLDSDASSAYGVFAVDLDTDGDMDILSAVYDGHEWYKNLTLPAYNGPVWHVSTTGSDDQYSGSGSSDYPFATIQHGIDAATDGDTVLVAAGTYTENVNYNGKNVVVGSLYLTTSDTSYISSTIIDGNESGSVVMFNSGEGSTAVLSGFTITNGSGYSGESSDNRGGGIYCKDSGPTLKHLIITSNMVEQGHGGGIYINDSNNGVIMTNVTISDNEIGENNNSGNGGGISSYSSSLTLTNVTVKNNEASSDGGGITFSGGVGNNLTLTNVSIFNNTAGIDGGGIMIQGNADMTYDFTNVTISNNTDAGPSGGDPPGGIWMLNGSLNLTNTILWGNSPNNLFLHNNSSSVTISYSDLEGGQDSIVNNGTVYWEDGNIDADPLFVDAANGDYRLSDYSPAIGAGTATGAPTTDIEGNPRPNPEGSNPDMGAYENALSSPANAAPTITSISNVSILEDASEQTINLTGIGDGDAITDQNLTITATSNNTSLIPTPTVNYTSGDSTGQLTFTPVTDANGTAVVTVRIQDDGGTENGGIDTVIIAFDVAVTSVNDAPTIMAISDPDTILEDSGEQIVNFGGISTGAANEDQTLTITATSSDISIIPNPTAVYTSPNAEGPRIGMYLTDLYPEGGAVYFDETNTEVTITFVDVPLLGDSDALNTFQVQLIYSSGEIIISYKDLSLSGSNTEQAPGGLAIGIANGEGDYDEVDLSESAGESYSFPVEGYSISNELDLAYKQITFTPNSDFSEYSVSATTITELPASYSNEITVEDDDYSEQSLSSYFEFYGNSYNQIYINNDGNIGFEDGDDTCVCWVCDDGDGDCAAEYLSGGSSTLSYTPVANGNGTATITVIVQDNGGTENDGLNSDTASFTVVVTAVNDPPVMADIASQSVDEDESVIISLVADDVDAEDVLVLFAYADTSAVLTSIDGESLTLEPIPDWNGTATITAGVSDGEYADSTTFSLTVNALNDAPQAFEVIYPSIVDTFSTHVDSDTPIPFTWYHSQDPDSEVDYTLTIELEFFGNTYTDVHENISDTTYTVYSNTLDILLQTLNLDQGTFYWFVQAFDDEYTTVSDTNLVVLIRDYVSTTDTQVIEIPGDYATIQEGIDAASEGDTVLVSPGTYVENINYNGKNIVVGSLYLTTSDTSYISSTIIDGNQSGSVVTFNLVEDSTAVLSGFTVQNGQVNSGGGISCNSSSPSLENIIITGNTSEGKGGGMYINNSNPTLTNVTISGNTASVGGGGIYCSSSSLTLTNVTISSNTSNGIDQGGGIYLENNTNLNLVNCILWNDSPQEIYAFPALLENTITISYSDIYGGQAGIVTGDNATINWGTGNIDSDPLFCDADNNDFTLYDNSPCVGTGENGANMGAYGIGCYSSSDEPPDTLWTKTFGGINEEKGKSVQQTVDGGYIIIGHTSTFGNGSEDTWLVKTDSNGNEEWNQTFGGSSSDYGHSIQQTTDGGYIIAGYTQSYGNGGADVWLIKTDSNGDSLWTKTFGGSSSDLGFSVQQTVDSGYIIAGYTQSYGNGGTDVWLIKTNSQGIEEWSQTFGGSEDDEANFVQQTSDGGYIITGRTRSYGNGVSDVWLIKTDSQGNEEWNQTFGGTDWDMGYSVQQTSDNGFILVGYTSSFGNGEPNDVWLIKTDSNGDSLWTKTFGGTPWEVGFSVIQTDDGGYVISGAMDQSTGSGHDAWIIKTDAEGNEEWNEIYGGASEDEFYSIQQTTDNGYIITGKTSSYGNGNSDIWLIRLEGTGVPPTYQGPVWHVSTTGSDSNDGSESSPFANIQTGIDASSSGHTVLVAAGTYTENINFNGKNISVIGEDSSNTIIDGNESGSVVHFVNNEDSTALLENFTIQNGSGWYGPWDQYRGGGIVIRFASPRVKSCIIENNNINNTAEYGGGIYIDGESSALLENLIIRNNISSNAGGISIYSTSVVTLKNSIVESNEGFLWGGGIAIIGDHILDNVIISSNEGNLGGGIYSDNSSFTFDGGTISNNTASGSGGGIYANNSSFTIDSSIIDNNVSNQIGGDWMDGGGGIYSTESFFIIENTTISNNSAVHNGGGVYFNNNTDQSIFDNCNISNNSAVNHGGAVFGQNSQIKFLSMVMDNNSAAQKGGAVFLNYCTSEFIRVRVYENEATSYGGGISLDHGSAVITNVTLVNNSAVDGGGIHVDYSGSGNYYLVFNNSILWGNTTNDITIDSEGNPNIIETYNYSMAINGLPGTGNLFSNPLFADINNGDLTLQWGSPAIDAGDPDLDGDLSNYTTDTDDQDPDGTRMDMGAYYFNQNDTIPPDLYISSLSSTNVGTEDSITVFWEVGFDVGLDTALIELLYTDTTILVDIMDPASGQATIDVPDSSIESFQIVVTVWDFVHNISSDTTETISVFDNTSPVVTVLNPQSGYSIPENTELTVTWNATDNISLDSIVINYSNDGGNAFTQVGEFSAGQGEGSFVIPPGFTTNAQLKLVVEDIYDNTGEGFSDNFTVTDNTPPTVELLSPVMDTELGTGTVTQITWLADDNDTVDHINLEYMTDALSWTVIAENEVDDGEFDWLVPNTPSTSVSLRVLAFDPGGRSDTSQVENLSIIISYPVVTQIFPSTNQLTWRDDQIMVTFSQAMDSTTFSMDNITIQANHSGDLNPAIRTINYAQSFILEFPQSFASLDTVTLTLSSEMTNVFGFELDGDGDEVPGGDYSFTYNVGMLADYDTTGTIDALDLATFVQALDEDDYYNELGPVTGTAPHFTSILDSVMDIEDVMAFVMMWNWYVTNNGGLLRQLADFGEPIDIEASHDSLYFDLPPGVLAYEVQVLHNPEIISFGNVESNSTVKLQSTDKEVGLFNLINAPNEQTHVSIPINMSGKEADITFVIRAIGYDNTIISQQTSKMTIHNIPEQFALHHNYPNPFNPVTTIQYDIPVDAEVLLVVYDILGRHVKTLVNTSQIAGYKSIRWNGTNDFGQSVSAGMYFYHLQTVGYSKVRKMVLLK